MNNVKIWDESETIKISEISVAVPWGIIAAKCWGEPLSKPVLVVHGLQDNAGSFNRLIPLLPKCFYYVCIDLPGHGKSTKIPPGFEMDFMHFISSIRRFVIHFSWAKFYILGHSLGGQLGTYYAAMYPEDVISVVVLDSVPQLAHPADDFLNYYRELTDKLLELEMKMYKSSPPNYTFDEAVQKLITQRPFPIAKDAALALTERGLTKGMKGYYFSADQRLKFGVLHPMMTEQSVINILKVQCPVLMIVTRLTYSSFMHDDKGGKAKPVLEALKTMKNVSLVLVDGYHDVHNNEPHVVAPYICEFFNKSHL